MIISLRRHVPKDQRGAAAVELTLLVPALLLILGLLVAGGRLWFARTTVNEAAQSAARAASLARSAAAAASRVETPARNRSPPRGSAAGPPRSRSVRLPSLYRSRDAVDRHLDDLVQVDFSDVFLPGWPGSVELTGRGSAALDTYRSR